MIDNPEYKGEWTVKRISNPAYKGVWEAKKIANPVADRVTYSLIINMHIHMLLYDWMARFRR